MSQEIFGDSRFPNTSFTADNDNRSPRQGFFYLREYPAPVQVVSVYIVSNGMPDDSAAFLKQLPDFGRNVRGLCQIKIYIAKNYLRF